MQVTIYLPDELARRARDARLNVSEVAQRALATTLDDDADKSTGASRRIFRTEQGQVVVLIVWAHSRVCLAGWLHTPDGRALPLLPNTSARNQKHRAAWTRFVKANRDAGIATLPEKAPW